ncbi:MAG: hypothetical protein GY870_01800, partial [archaeon]|nr:hypothetical protein [archaeon]
IDPDWDEPLDDQTEEFGNPFYYNVNASDASGIEHYEISDMSNFTINTAGEITNNTILSFYVYNLEIRAYDNNERYCANSITITVQDTIDPEWDEPLDDQTEEFGNSFYYNVNASDASGIDHYEISDMDNFTINSNGEIYNNTFLSVYIYSLEVRAYDNNERSCATSITITVEDTIDPDWDELLEDQAVEFGSSFYYNVNASDLFGIDYYWLNNFIDFSVDETGIIINNTDLTVNIYDLEVRAFDNNGRYCTTSILITVQDTVNPKWDIIPQDQTVEYGDSFSYELNASDLSGIHNYWINNSDFYISDNLIVGSNHSLSIMNYIVEIRAYDLNGNYCNISISIFVKDTTAPQFGDLVRDSYIITGDFSINWLANDLNPSNYTIYKDNIEVKSGEWDSFYSIGIDLVDLEVGTYNYSIVVMDLYGNIAKSYIIITVIDNSGAFQMFFGGLIAIIGSISGVSLSILFLKRKRGLKEQEFP